MSAAPRRCVVCIDVDYFYCQVELLERPELHERPVAVTQKYIIVTCNYVARKYGVSKLESIDSALRKCPALVLINGEDLTKYRAKNVAILQALRDWDDRVVVERAAMDEFFVDVTAVVRARVATGDVPGDFAAHVVRAVDAGDEAVDERDLRVASHIAVALRAAIHTATGLTSCSGTARVRLLAKIAVDLHKPDDSTTVLPSGILAPRVLGERKVGDVYGIGRRMRRVLTAAGVHTVADVRARTQADLVALLGARDGEHVFAWSHGRDESPVKAFVAPTVISVEESSVRMDRAHFSDIVAFMASDLADRIRLSLDLSPGHRPSSFFIRFRLFEARRGRTGTRRVPLLSADAVDLEKQGRALWDKWIGRDGAVKNFAIGVTAFTADGKPHDGAAKDEDEDEDEGDVFARRLTSTSAAVASPPARQQLRVDRILGEAGAAKPPGPANVPKAVKSERSDEQADAASARKARKLALIGDLFG